VVERAAGNPFFVEELLHVLEETGGIVKQGGYMQLVSSAAARLPSTLTEILLARLDGLREEVRGRVQIASVIGRSFAVDLLARVSSVPARSLEGSLGVLVRAEIAFPIPGMQSEYAFKHVTMRDVAYNTLLLRRRKELHAGTARAIMTLYPTDEFAEIIAYHFSQTDEHSLAAEWLERAGDRSAGMYANQTAIGHYEEARRRLQLPDADRIVAARIAEKLGCVFLIVTWYEEALEELEAAADAYRERHDLEAEARTVAKICQVHFLRGASEEAIDRVQSVLDQDDVEVDDETSARSLAGLYVALVDPLYHLNRFEDALIVAWRAVELAREQGDERLLREATVRYGLALQGIGRLDEARQVLEDAIREAETAGDLASLAQALVWMGDICMAQGQPREGRMYYERAKPVDENRGDLGETASLLGRLGQVAFILGDWEEARGHFEQAVDLVRSISFAHFSPAALMALGEQYLREGAVEEASRYLEEPFTIAERSGQVAQIPYLHIPLADWDLFQGEPDAALTRLGPLLKEYHFETSLDHRAMQIAAESHFLNGNDETARAMVTQGLAHARGQTNRLALLGWLQLQAVLMAGEGRWDEAEEFFEEGLSLARDMPHPYQEACTLSRLGLLKQERDLDGRPQLDLALEIFERLGARPYQDRIRSALGEPSVL